MSDGAGSRIGDYEILGVLGAGGMGKVFKVRNVLSDRVEAMKILLPDLAGREDLASRFLREIKVLGALNHPNIASLRTALTLGNQLVMIMEYVEGTTLAEVLARAPIHPRDAKTYTDQILDALSYAHKRGVIHRDIKPANMMLTPDGVIKLMDFGIARSGNDQTLTAAGTTLGSLYYMSPEQVKGEPTDARSDLYSLGVSLYEMVTGKRPFRADSDYSLMAAHVQQPVIPPIELRSDLPTGLNEIILMAMAKEPSRRFQTADAFRNALSKVEAPGIETRPAQVLPPPANVSAVPQNSSPSAAVQPAPEWTTPLAADAASTPLSAQAQKHIPDVPEVAPGRRDSQHSHRGLYMALGALTVVAGLTAAALFPSRSKAVALVRISITPDSSTATAGSSASFIATGTYNDGTKKDLTLESTWASGNTALASMASPSQNPELVNCLTAGSGLVSAAIGNISGSATLTCNTPTTQTPSLAPAENRDSAASRPGPLKQAKGSGNTNTGSATEPSQNGVYSRAREQQVPEADSIVQAGARHGEELQNLEDEFDQLSSRASSINDSLDALRTQQSQEGLSLREDIATAQQMMKTYLSKAQSALQAEDGKAAKRYLELAEPQVEKLQKFLGH